MLLSKEVSQLQPMESMISIVKFLYSKKLYYFPFFLSLSFIFCTYLGTNNEEKFSATSIFSFVLHSLISLKILLDKGTKHFFFLCSTSKIQAQNKSHPRSNYILKLCLVEYFDKGGRFCFSLCGFFFLFKNCLLFKKKKI